jgi:hypothetical protein
VERHHLVDRDDGDRAPQVYPVERAAEPGIIDRFVIVIDEPAALSRWKQPLKPGTRRHPHPAASAKSGSRPFLTCPFQIVLPLLTRVIPSVRRYVDMAAGFEAG